MASDIATVAVGHPQRIWGRARIPCVRRRQLAWITAGGTVLALAGCGGAAPSASTAAAAHSASPSQSLAPTPAPHAPVPYAGKPTPSGPMPTPPPAATVACTLDDLEVAGWPGGYLSDETESVEFTNTTSNACYMAGTPAIQLTRSPGVVQAVPPGQFAALTVDVEPGQSALLLFGSSGMCAASETPPAQPTSVMVRLANGDAWTITESMEVGCGAPSVVVFGASAGTPPSSGMATATSPAVVAGVPSSAG